MTLHETQEFGKKFSIGGVIGLAAILVLVLIFRIGVTIKDILFPPIVDAPNMAYGELTPLEFPSSDFAGDFTYELQTSTGTLPDDIPDRLHVYPVINEAPGLNNLEQAKEKILKLGFVTPGGDPIIETPLSEREYQWIENKGLKRDIKLDIVSFDFTLQSEYLTALTVLGGKKVTDEQAAISTVKGILANIALFPDDIDLDKTSIPDEEKHYITKPELYDISNGNLVSATSLSKTKVIRVDLYQKDIEFELDNGLGEKTPMKLPILYPKPPYSTMNFLLASGQNNLEIVKAEYTHQAINLQPETQGVYPIKSAEDAYRELREGQAYIAFYKGTSSQILITNVYLAYYLGYEKQDYLMPVYVFEGKDGFFAFVAAVDHSQQPQTETTEDTIETTDTGETTEQVPATEEQQQDGGGLPQI